MKKLRPIVFPLFLLGLVGLAYGLSINSLGFYWDDFPMLWIARTYGPDGLARYFSTNRPVWGLIYRITVPLFNTHPLAWQVFALFWRWTSGLALWGLLRLVWPKRPSLAAWAAALFVVYPGFSQQYISLVYSHFFLILTCFLASLALNLLAMRRPGRFWPLTAAAWLLSALNLLSMEYFFLLDLLRPVLIWLVCSESIPNLTARLKRTLLNWLPYLALLGGVVVWRSFFFGFHTYQPTLTSRLRTQPLSALVELIRRVVGDAWLTSAAAWARAALPPTWADLTARQWQIYVAVCLAVFVATAAFFWFFAREAHQKLTFWQRLAPLGLGLLALLVCGAPFWLTDLQVKLQFHADRFTLAFMLGAVLVFAGLLHALPLPRWSQVLLLAAALGMAAGLQFANSVAYRRDWAGQRTLFWQLTWRAPALQPGTILLANELPLEYYSDNSLTAPLNWIYAPKNFTQQMSFMLYYPTVRLGTQVLRLEKDLPVDQDYLAARFTGSTSQMVTVYYNPPGCLRVMDPEVESDNWTVPGYLRDTLPLSSTRWILAQGADGQTAVPPQELYGSEPAHGWCYYFEKADLARQLGDWAQVAKLGDEGFANGDYPNDPLERLPFIEGYAHVGNWQRALDLTRESDHISPMMAPMLCHVWERIELQTQPGEPRSDTLQTVRSELACP